MYCHFVYSVPNVKSETYFDRLSRKLRYKMHSKGMNVALLTKRRLNNSDFDSWPIASPFENTKNIYQALNEILPTFLYHLTERVHCRFQPDDVFIGHPYFPHTEGGYGVTEMALKEKIRPKKVALITPLHCDITIKTDHINKDFLEDIDKLIPAADILFAIMGEYWWDQWDLSPYSHWKAKMVRLDMAVNAEKYPRIKKSFNQPGRRGYLYIGDSNDPRKGAYFLSRLMEQCDNYPKGWIGSGPEIPNVPRISQRRSLTPEFMRGIANNYDFFISPSIADPNPTTILESMSWGFPVICTPQSGYYEESYRKNIYCDDIEKSVNVLLKLQNAPETELINMSNEARKVVESRYTWKNFTGTIISKLFS